MAETFSVGEVAVIRSSSAAFNGTYCTILALPQLHDYWASNGKLTRAGTYLIETHAGVRSAREFQLRKRRPPPDWVKLCHLTDLPREVTHV